MDKKLIGIFCGGNSIEREFSIKSAHRIKNVLDELKFESIIIDISDTENMFKLLMDNKISIAYIVNYGVPGQDGAIQGLLDLCNIKYTGSDLTTCAIIKDKLYAKLIFKALSINTPKFEQVYKDDLNSLEYLESKIKKIGDFPVVIKPIRKGGLSKGISVLENIDEVKIKLEQAFMYDERVMFEEYIEGDELTVCVLEKNNDIKILPYVGVIHEARQKISTYDDKINGTRSLKIPADVSCEVKKEIDNICKKIFQTLNCKHYVYFDFIIKNEVPYLIEMGAVPGFSEKSNLPLSSQSVNISLSDIVKNNVEDLLRDNYQQD